LKKIILILIALVFCSGCYDFDFNDTPDNSISNNPQIETRSGDMGEPIFEDSITLEDLVVENRTKTEIIAQRDEEIDALEELAMQKQRAIENIVAENDKIKDDINTIKSIMTTTGPTTKPSIESHLKTIGNSSDIISGLITDPIGLDIGPVDLDPIDIGPIDVPIDVPMEGSYVDIQDSKIFWLGIIFGILGLALLAKIVFTKK